MSVESMIRASVRLGDPIPTPSGSSHFTIDDITPGSIAIRTIGGNRRVIPWSLLDEVLDEMPRDSWMRVGADHKTAIPEGTLEALLMPSLHGSGAPYVAALLARAGLVELDTTRPHRVRRI